MDSHSNGAGMSFLVKQKDVRNFDKGCLLYSEDMDDDGTAEPRIFGSPPVNVKLSLRTAVDR